MTSAAAPAATLGAALTVALAGWYVRWQLPPARRPVDLDARPQVPSTARAGRGRQRRRRTPDEQQLAAWCQHVARQVRTGSSLPSAFEAACERIPTVGAEFADVVRAQVRGSSLAGALARRDHDGEAVGLVVAVVRTCARLGGPAAEPLDRACATLHRRAAARCERRVHSAQAEMSAKVLTLLPLGVLTLLVATDADVRQALARPIVQTCLALGLALNALGWWWMRRIIANPDRAPRGLARRRLHAASRSLPEGIEILVACLHAGLTPAQLVEHVLDDLPEPLRPAFEAVNHRLHRGQRFADAIGELPVHIGAEAHALSDSLAAAERYGLPLGPVLDGLAAEAVDARRRHGEADARRLPVRLSFPLVATTLPSFVLIAIAPAVVGALSTLTVPTV
ncbi:type II secretion system F family protein [soil metagenome]